MKPFDLEAAKRGHPIITRDGRPAKFIAHVPEANSGSRVLVLIGATITLHYEDGTFYGSNNQYIFDLFMAPRKRVVWVNLMEDYSACWYDSEEAANAGSIWPRLGNRAYPLEIEE